MEIRRIRTPTLASQKKQKETNSIMSSIALIKPGFEPETFSVLD